jgi:hypothetical protein
MNHLTHTRRRLIAAALTLSTLTAVAADDSHTAIAKESRIRRSLCRYDWRDGRRQVKRLIRCSVRRWHVPGGASKAITVARKESGFRPRAYNPAGYKGIYQQSARYWRRRARQFGFPDWSAFNGRANVMVSIQMAHRGGWGPWSTA